MQKDIHKKTEDEFNFLIRVRLLCRKWEVNNDASFHNKRKRMHENGRNYHRKLLNFSDVSGKEPFLAISTMNT